MALFALILPFPCPLSSATDFQILETIPAPALSPPCVPRPPGVHPRQGQTETEWSCGRGRLWPVWCEILKCQGTAGEMTDKFVIKLFTKEGPLVVLAFSCSFTRKPFLFSKHNIEDPLHPCTFSLDFSTLKGSGALLAWTCLPSASLRDSNCLVFLA